MNLKGLMKKIFGSVIKIFKDGIKFYLESYEQAYKLDLYRIKKYGKSNYKLKIKG